MKKGTQITILAAVACIALGGVLMGAGVAAGGREQIAAGHFVFVNGRGTEQLAERFWEDGSLGDGVHMDHGYYDVPDVPDVPDMPDVSGLSGTWKGQDEESGQEVLSGDFVRTIASGNMPRNLKVTLGIHSLDMVESDGQDIVLSGENCDRIQCYVKGDTLYIRDVGKNKKYKDVRSRVLTLAVPEEMLWKEAKINAELGTAMVDRLEADEVELEAELGQITVETLHAAKKLEIDAELGSVEVVDGYAREVEFSASMGSVQYNGTLAGDAKAEAEMGSIELNLFQTETDFDFEIKASMGKVEINGEENHYSYSGMEKEKKIDNGTGRKMELETSMGGIVISFE